MRVLVRYRISNNLENYSQYQEVDTINDLRKLVTQSVGDAYTKLERSDGQSVTIVESASVKTEVYTQMPLLLKWIKGEVDVFPESGSFTKASI
jgi:hypothetical protein